jgi:FHA domain
MTKRFQLRGNSGALADQIIELLELEITLGRDLSNDLVVSDSEVSRAHARLSWRDDGYVIEDLRSTNGTWVNGHPVLRASRLAEGDVVTLGKVSAFVFEMVPESVTDTTPNQDAASLPELIESTMMMPAWQHAKPDTSKASRATSPRSRVRPSTVLPAGDIAEAVQPPPPSEMELSPGRAIHRRYTACLQSGDLDGLRRLYYPNATLLTGDAVVSGSREIGEFFEQYFGGVGCFGAAPTGKYVEGKDSILCETRVETADEVVRLADAFVMRYGKITHHFSSTLERTPKLSNATASG